MLKRNELPKKVDKDPTFRAQAMFTKRELVDLVTNRAVPEERRMLYELMGIGGMRFGEAIARRWRDYDSETELLGKLLIASSFCVKTHKEKSVKTKSPREMPVHPRLASMLSAWKRDGWSKMMGRPPLPEDLIVPSNTGNFRNVNRGLHNFHLDLKRIGQRRRRQHDLRRAFVTLARAGGAKPDILRWATHGSTGDIIDIYTSMPWKTLCEAVACLDLDDEPDPPTGGNSTNDGGNLLPFYYHQPESRKTPEVTSTSGVKSWRSGRDSNERW